jgi:serine/threonine-protein kinase
MAAADRHLLFGMLALQNGLIDQVQLVAAFQAWTRDKTRPLAEYLMAHGDLDAGDRAAVDAIVERHLRKHDGDIEKSLAWLVVGHSTFDRLAGVGDSDLAASLPHLKATEPDPDATSTFSIGSSTSGGQRFRVLRPHARGGLGAVFVALDAELNRQVALKQILDHHADDPTCRHRFLIEAEVTGGLEHPGIVPVYGLGTYADGRPFYAMRFIQGDSLKEAIEGFHGDEMRKVDRSLRSLELRKLLRRFTDVCNALEYAHARGVLHRDIKPENIIVGKYGETLIVDWGLAKATGKSDPAADERTLMPSSASGSAETLPGSAVGTPAYMSPEQARGDLDALGPRSDVYSLGATPYSLLTGRPPQEGDDLGEVLRRVQKGEFPPPRRLDSSIDRSLEAVCLKAMDARSENRYESCRALAEDIERWLADEPMAVRREPLRERVSRWIRKHPVATSTAAAALVVGLAASLYGLGRERTFSTSLAKANAALDVQRQRAEDREQQAIDAVKRFRDAVANEKALKDNPSLNELRSRLLKEPLTFFRNLRDRLRDDKDTRPESLARLASASLELGELTEQIRNKQDALTAYREALAVREKLARDFPTIPQYQRDLAVCQSWIAGVLGDTGRIEEAKAFHEAAISTQERLAQAHPNAPDLLSGLAAELHGLATLLGSQGLASEALAKYQRARALSERAVSLEPRTARYRVRLARHLSSIGALHSNSGRPTEGLEAARSGLEVVQGLLAEDAQGEFQNILGELLIQSGFMLKQTGNLDAAGKSFEDGRIIFQRLVERSPSMLEYRRSLAYCHEYLAGVYSETGQSARARDGLKAALTIRRKLAEDNPSVVEYQRTLAQSHSNLGIELVRNGNLPEAKHEYETAQAIWKQLTRGNPADWECRRSVAYCHISLGKLLLQTGQAAGAHREFEAAVAIAGALAKSQSDNSRLSDPLSLAYNEDGNLLYMAGRLGEARDAYGKALAIRERLARDNPTVTELQQGLATSHERIGSLLGQTGQPIDALAAFERARVIQERLTHDNPSATQFQSELARTHCNIGVMLSQLGKPAEAVAAYGRARAVQERLVRDNPSDIQFQQDLANSLNNMANLLGENGKPAEALAALKCAREIRERLAREHPESPGYASDLGATLHNIATPDLHARRFGEARKRLREAILWQKKALAANPRHPTYRQFLANHLTNLIAAARGLGDEAEAVQAERELEQLRATDPRFEALDARLAAVLKGAGPKDNAERLALAQRAYDTRHFVAAVKLWAEALISDPGLVANRQTQHPYNAACAAALAAAGRGEGELALDDAAKSELRQKAHQWLTLELTAWSRLLQAGPSQARPVIAQTLKHWQQDADLAGVRDRAALSALPERERQDWQALWARVEALLQRAEAGGAPKAEIRTLELPANPFIPSADILSEPSARPYNVTLGRRRGIAARQRPG